jgi:hypothetical protein
MIESARELSSFDRGESAEKETIAHRSDDAVVTVNYAGRAEEQGDLALPRERSAAIAPQMPRPGAVVDFAQRGQQFGLRVWAHGEDRAEIFQGDNAEITQLPQ